MKMVVVMIEILNDNSACVRKIEAEAGEYLKLSNNKF